MPDSDTVKIQVNFHPNYRGKVTKRVELDIPADARCHWKQEHGCLVVSDSGGDALAAFNGVAWFAREELSASQTYIPLPADEA